MKRLSQIIWLSEPVGIEALSGFMALFWGLWMLSPTWSVFATSPFLFTLLARVAPEKVWGILFAILGLLQLACLYKDRRGARAKVAFAAVFVWTFVAVSAIVSNPSAVGWITYSLTVLGNAWTYLRLRLIKS